MPTLRITSGLPVMCPERVALSVNFRPTGHVLHKKGAESAPPLANHRTDSNLSEPAVDVDFDTGDVGRILRGQKSHCACHFIRLSDSIHRNLREELFFKAIDGFL